VEAARPAMGICIGGPSAPNGPTVPALAVAAAEAAHAEVTVTAVGQVVTGTETRIIRAAPAVASTAAAETAASHLRHTATGKVETGATGRHSATVPPRPPHTESGNLRAEGRTGVAAATTVVVETRKRPAPRKFPASPECEAWASGQNILARRGKDTTTTASRKSRNGSNRMNGSIMSGVGLAAAVAAAKEGVPLLPPVIDAKGVRPPLGLWALAAVAATTSPRQTLATRAGAGIPPTASQCPQTTTSTAGGTRMLVAAVVGAEKWGIQTETTFRESLRTLEVTADQTAAG